MVLPKIVIIGGGAAGLEVATTLGRKLGNKYASITLVDQSLTNVWKPLWHEVAAGTIAHTHAKTDYILQGYKHNFSFHLGKLAGVDLANKKLTLHEMPLNTSVNSPVLPMRSLDYDYLILSIGSLHNDFNIDGVEENCYFFDSYSECLSFQQELMSKFLAIHEGILVPINLVIVGGGATGVELAAELYYAFNNQLQYSKKAASLKSLFNIAIIESSDRILSNMPEEISAQVSQRLIDLGIKIYVNEKVSKVEKQSIHTHNGISITANLKVWAAGIKSSDSLAWLGLAIDKANRVIVDSTLQSITNSSIFALGDCASCPIKQGADIKVPATAQAAHQQAVLLAKSLIGKVKYNRDLLMYTYQERGAIVSVRQDQSVGYIKGGKLFDKVTIHGKFAQIAYRFLYRTHQASLHGWWATVLLIIAEVLTKKFRSRLKLH